MRTIMLLNSKGGCGKSMLATNLASYYALQAKSVVLADFDPQGSSTEWLKTRSEERPPIKGIVAWKEPLRVPRDTDYVIMDVPAGCHGPELTALVCRPQSIIIPVLPSPTDIRAAVKFVHELLLKGRVSRKQTKLAVVANRVYETNAAIGAFEQVLNSMNIAYASLNTQIYKRLERFLRRLKIPFVATMRDNPNYLVADERGLGIFELSHWKVARDVEQWQALIKWLNSKRSLPS